METQTLFEVIRQMEANEIVGETQISKYVSFNLRENVEKIEAYLNSKHTSGETDSQGRDKPFFNIVTAAVNIWFRATDIDRKNIRIKATKRGQTTIAFLASILLQEWMRKSAFGIFLNDWGRTLSRYGSAVSKFVEKDGELHCEIIHWNRLICDAVDFENNIKIEKLWLTPAQLKQKKEYDKELVKKLLDNLEPRKTMDGQKKDNKSEYIPIYEVHGEMPLIYLTGKEADKDGFVQQIQVITFLQKKDKPQTGDLAEFDDYTLYAGKEAKDPYQIDHLIKEDGRTMAIGAVEHLFQAQWMVNHTQKAIKDHLDLASKMLHQTSDGNLIGHNVLTDLENGQVLIHALNQPITRLNNSPDITALQNNGREWQMLGAQITNTPEAQRGANPPSGTAWRLQEAIIQQSQSLFELMTENKGLAIEQMLIKFIIPYLKKKIDTTKEISAILEAHQLKQIDSLYSPNHVIKMVNEKKKSVILSGQIYDPANEPMDNMTAQSEVKNELDSQGNQRFISPSDVPDKTWKEVFKDLEWECEVDITGEQVDTASAMATYNTVLQFLMGLQGRQMTSEERIVFDKLLTRTGDVSPVEIKQTADGSSDASGNGNSITK